MFKAVDCSWSRVWTLCLVMQTLYKGTLNEAFTIRQIVDAVVLSKNLLPLVKM